MVCPPVDKTKFVEDWTAKHMQYISLEEGNASRRRLPAAPGKSSPDSDEASSNTYDRHSLSNKLLRNGVREFDRCRNRSLPKRSLNGFTPKNETNENGKVSTMVEVKKKNELLKMNSSGSDSAPNSARSGSSESSGYHSRQDVSRLSTRRKETVTISSSSSLNRNQNRSNSSLTSHEADFQAWRRRKEYKPFSLTTRKISDQRATTVHGIGQADPAPPYKQPLMMTRSLKMSTPSTSMKRANSFHQEEFTQARMDTVKEN